MFHLGWARKRVNHVHFDVVALQLPDDVGDLRVADVRDVFFEGEAHDEDAGIEWVATLGEHAFDHLLAHMGTHGVIDKPARIDDPGVVAELVRFPRQVVGVDANAVSAHQTGAELQEVPFRPCGFQDLVRVDADALEDDAQLVDKGDVDVALRILDDLGGLSHLDA